MPRTDSLQEAHDRCVDHGVTKRRERAIRRLGGLWPDVLFVERLSQDWKQALAELNEVAAVLLDGGRADVATATREFKLASGRLADVLQSLAAQPDEVSLRYVDGEASLRFRPGA